MPHHCYLHNQLLCNSIKVIHCGGEEILSSEGTTLCEPTAMGAYGLGILSLIKFLLEFANLNKINAKEVAFTNDFSVAGTLNSIKDHWNKSITIGPKYG